MTASGSIVTSRLDPGRAGVRDRDAREHVLAVDPVAERRRCGGELDAGVDALGLGRIGGDVGDDVLAAGDEIAHGVGQVELALDVVRLEPVERRPEQVAAEDVDRGVALLDRELLGRGVAGLDDPLDRSVRRRGRCGRTRGRPRARRRGRSQRRPRRGAPRRAPRAARSSGAACRRRGRGRARRSPPRPPAPSGRHRLCRAPAPEPRRRVSPNSSRLSGEAITTSGSGPSGRAASSTQSTIRRPRIGCRCFGVDERMRVPSPPAITTAAIEVSVTGRLGRQDSNLGSRDQNPLPYRLATPHGSGRSS